MTQEQHKYYSNGYDDGKQSVGDQYVQILLKKEQEIERLTEQNHKLMAENDTTSEVYGETKDLLEACKSANELMDGEIETLKAELANTEYLYNGLREHIIDLKAENSKMRKALEAIREIKMIDYSAYMKIQGIIRETII